MANKVLPFLKDMPTPVGDEETLMLPRSGDKVTITEMLENPRYLDIVVDVSNKSVVYRVDGKGKGEEYRKWVAILHERVSRESILSSIPIGRCIIRCLINESPKFVKIFMVASVDIAEKKVRLAPLRKLPEMGTLLGMDTMPIAYDGSYSERTIFELSRQSLLGLPRKGLIICNDGDRPLRYLVLTQETEDNGEKRTVKRDEVWCMRLADEIANIMIQEGPFKANIHSKADITSLINKTYAEAKESGRHENYIQRIRLEAGIGREEADKKIKEAIKLRCEDLGRKYVVVNA